MKNKMYQFLTWILRPLLDKLLADKVAEINASVRKAFDPIAKFNGYMDKHLGLQNLIVFYTHERQKIDGHENVIQKPVIGVKILQRYREPKKINSSKEAIADTFQKAMFEVEKKTTVGDHLRETVGYDSLTVANAFLDKLEAHERGEISKEEVEISFND